MVTINTPEDLLRVLAENPEWKAAVRREILTEELLNLPARFDSFVEEQQQFNDEQRQFNERIDNFVSEQHRFNDEQRQFNERIDNFVSEQHRFNDKQHQFNDRVEHFMARTDQRFGRLEGDISEMKNTHAVSKTAREAPGIAREMGFNLVRTLTYDDLLEMHLAADTTGIDTPSLRSFRRADLVIEAADENGATHYIAMEISYTADQRDTGRAIRNADFLTRFTGHPSHAAIASIRNDRQIQSVIDSGQVFWYELDDRRPRVESLLGDDDG